MRAATKKSLIVAVLVMLVLVLVVWYLSTRAKAYTSAALAQIDYKPPASAGSGAYLTFTFSAPLPKGVDIASSSANLVSFTPSAGPASAAPAMIKQLTAGPPFVPTLVGTSRFVITTNTLPANMPAVPVTVTGAGSMRFALPG